MKQTGKQILKEIVLLFDELEMSHMDRHYIHPSIRLFIVMLNVYMSLLINLLLSIS